MRDRGRCVLCHGVSLLSSYLGVCPRCVREEPEEATAVASKRHAAARQALGLPSQPPRSSGGIPCKLCAAECIMAEGERGYCGIRGNRGGRIYSLARRGAGLLHYYLDPHVTNCCNAYFCPAGTGCGYPRYAYREGPELGYYNLALFFYGCGLNCLFCQNWSHKLISEAREVEARELVDMTLSNPKISC